MEKVVKLLPHQLQLLQSSCKTAGIVGGRGSGKSVILAILAMKEIIAGSKVLIFGANYKTLSLTLFKEIIEQFRNIGLEPRVNRGEMSIKYGDGELYGLTYENVDAARGFTKVHLLLLDELCLAPADLLETVAPALRGCETPSIIRFATSPRKGTVWNKWFEDEDIELIRATMMDNKFLKKEDIELQKKTIKDANAYRQEILGEILDDTVDFCIISPNDYPLNKQIPKGEKTLGIDLSGYGADENIFVVSDESSIVEIVRIQIADTFKQYNIAKELIQKHNIKLVNLDASGGFGWGLTDMLKKDNINVTTINFGQAAKEKEKYANIRAEMYMNAVQKIRDGFYVDNEELKQELAYTSYKITNSGKTMLEPKSTVKELLGHSPDIADAFVLSLYKPDTIIYNSPNESLNIALKFASV